MHTEIFNGDKNQFKPDTDKNGINGEQTPQRLPEALNTQKDEAEAEKAAMQVAFIFDLLNKIISSKTK